MTCHHASMARERGTRLREKRAKWVTDEDIRNLYMWQPEPKYDFEQGMVLKLEEDGKHALKHAFRRNIQGLADASSTQGIYFRAMHDGNDIPIWKQATVDIDGNPANHGWFMHYEEKTLGEKRDSGWYISKHIYEDDEGNVRCYKHNGGGVVGWFGNSREDMSGPVHMPFYGSHPVAGIKIFPWSEYMAERLSYVLLMGAYIELDVMGVSIL